MHVAISINFIYMYICTPYWFQNPPPPPLGSISPHTPKSSRSTSESQHWMNTVISCQSSLWSHQETNSHCLVRHFFNTLLLTEGVKEVGNLLDASSDYLYVLSIGPVLLNWSLVALNMALIMRMVRHCWHITEVRRHAYFHWINFFLLSNQGTVYYRPLKDPLPEGQQHKINEYGVL